MTTLTLRGADHRFLWSASFPAYCYVFRCRASNIPLGEQAATLPAAMMDTASPVDEAGLIRAAQRGDEEAFELLVRAHDEGVLRLAMNLLRSEEDARDVYQETFLRAHRSLPRYRFDSSFHTWLYRITTNLCVDQLRKRKRRRAGSAQMRRDDGAAGFDEIAGWTVMSGRLGADQRAFQEHKELVGEQPGLRRTGLGAQRDQVIAGGLLALLDHAARRMLLLRQLDGRIGECTTS